MILPDQKTLDYWIAKAFNYSGAFPYHASDNAPNDWQSLKEWQAKNVLGLHSFPVFAGSSETAIYSQNGNYLFRAWHDSLHLKHNFNFSRYGELSTASEHIKMLQDINAPEAVLLAVQADTIGQYFYTEITGGFIDNQKYFVQDCLTYGINTILDCVKLGKTY